ncbi:cytochrome c [Trinickia caryophylli]|uniref:Cytochrome C oxidase, cbb3-type, subunit III n=1 Tax=Trinickia caryophylli TaxID=28094 RepID=A0A1X7E2S8_TRICW|nr:cytochrome c [Trinickia caryophylli]PMS14286.1 methanol dehydrogenase [Trinickia caryophylli]TRX20215.1 cytochrome c [Trinickia caryophylli]WQE13781.1 cytochrome c [Trinickia caryophylli]SMF26280.1 Cytochrome C oxidase, cbb3-type, subunit III [Trinickia caryophylli]GLU32701.1 hypothetical protein Busp01_25430 [Trinickia caryophylli]
MKGRSILLLTTITAAVVALPVVYAQNKPAMAQQVAYKVVDGSKVDDNTLQGWKTWRALDCQRCHGAKQEGLVGPSLIDAFKVIDKDEFKRTVFGGRVAKGMPDFSASERMQKNWENLYAYLKGRSDGKINPGDLHPLNGN